MSRSHETPRSAVHESKARRRDARPGQPMRSALQRYGATAPLRVSHPRTPGARATESSSSNAFTEPSAELLERERFEPAPATVAKPEREGVEREGVESDACARARPAEPQKQPDLSPLRAALSALASFARSRTPENKGKRRRGVLTRAKETLLMALGRDDDDDDYECGNG